MATNEDLNSTGSVPGTDSPQETPTANTGAGKSEDFQATTNPNNVANTGDSLSVQETGDPITGGVTDVSSASPWVFGGVGIILLVAIVLFAVRLKNFSSLGGSFSLSSEEDLPKPKSSKPASVKKPAAKTATKKPATKAKKTPGKKKGTRRSRH